MTLISPPPSTQTTLDQVDMEDDMKMLVSDEIKRFRESYQVCASPSPHSSLSHSTPLHKPHTYSYIYVQDYMYMYLVH